MNYTELILEPNSNYHSNVKLDMSTEIGIMTPSLKGLSWKIKFSTDSQNKISEVNDPFMGDLMRLEEYDFEADSIKLL
jgi:hypothetical protein